MNDMLQHAEQYDVLIIGAGLSGVGAAVHLTKQCPGKSFALLEQRENTGGTWDLFRYPGIRSDSDMHTLGYRFKPWLHEKSIADGPSIHDYVRETAAEFGVTSKINFGHKMLAADWSSETAAWTVTAIRLSDGVKIKIRANFLFMCAGYYDYDAGYRPDFPGEKDFAGQIIHPQHWPENLDYKDKNIIVIGSGATAVTIVPVMAKTAAKVTMLQRSPTFMASRPAKDVFANSLRKIIPNKAAYAITRWKNINFQRIVYYLARKNPDRVGKKLLQSARKAMPRVQNFEENFVPRYGPWEQRLCLVPDGDMFSAINAGRAEIVTDHVERFTATGILLKSGKHIDADIIVTATGLNLVLLGSAALSVDGVRVDLSNHFNYKGVMFSDIPNMASVFGYINASWTLKADIACDYVCRLLNKMDEKGARIALPYLGETDMERLPFVDDFTSGYFARSFDKLPSNSRYHPWRTVQNYAYEKRVLTKMPVDDGIMRFGKPTGVKVKQTSIDILEDAE